MIISYREAAARVRKQEASRIKPRNNQPRKYDDDRWESWGQNTVSDHDEDYVYDALFDVPNK